MSLRPEDADQSHKDRLDDAHFRFLEARRDNNVTREALCKAGRAVETARRERDALYTQWNQLHASAKRGQLSATSLKELDEALEHLQDKQATFNKNQELLAEAMKNDEVTTMKLVVAKRDGERLRCPESHIEQHDENEFRSKEEEHRKRSERQAQQKTQRGEHNVSNENERTYGDYVHNIPFTTPTDSDNPLRNPSAEPRSSTPLSSNRTSQTPMSAHRYTPEWLETAQRLFRDYTSIKEFPEPPARQCG